MTFKIMICFPNAKINLGLQITERLSTGYHAINTIFYPIPITDSLEFVESKKVGFTSSGIAIPGNAKENIVLKAYQMLKKDFQLPNISIHLLKQIPIGAGLGGGSADAAFMLSALNEHFQLFLDDELLEQYASQLGSDCTFFIKNEPAFATGTGTTLETMDLDLKGHWLVLINPNIHISTQEAYAGVSPKEAPIDLKSAISLTNMKDWKKILVNDFEASIFQKYPDIQQIKTLLYEEGATYASMSGSGSSIFGIFEEKPYLNTTTFKDYYVRTVVL